MIIYAVDDEPLQLLLLKKNIKEARPESETYIFRSAEEVLSKTGNECPAPDIVFLDIEMPGMGGIELAKHIKVKHPSTRVIFVTGFSEYAAEAYKIHAKGYILKPPTVERIKEEMNLEETASDIEKSNKRVKIHSFGNFEVFIDNKPIKFKYNKTKELLAYLIDEEGALCDIGEIISILWENDIKENKYSYMRSLRADLLDTFTKYECLDIFFRQRGKIAINKDKVDCDYYRWINGDPNILNHYNGEYMSQYSWGEHTLGKMERLM